MTIINKLGSHIFAGISALALSLVLISGTVMPVGEAPAAVALA